MSERPNFYRYTCSGLVLIIFMAGWLGTRSAVTGFGLPFLGLNSLCMGMGILICLTGRRDPSTVLPVWTIAGLFIVAFFLKFYWLMLLPESVLIVGGDVMKSLYRKLHDPSTAYMAFQSASIGFISVSLTAWLAVKKWPLKELYSGGSGDYEDRVLKFLSIMLPVSVILAAVILFLSGVGVMGLPSIRLPFRMAGWIYYVWSVFLPVLMLVYLTISDAVKRHRHFMFGISLFVVHGVSDMMIRSSRGTLLKNFILLFFVFLVTKRLNRKRVSLVIGITMIAVFLFPIFYDYRSIRMTKTGVPVLTALVEASETVWTGENAKPLRTLNTAFVSILMRLNGIENLFHIVGSPSLPLYTKSATVSINEYYTFDVLGHPRSHIQGSSPTMVGWLYIVGGNLLVCVGMSAITLVVWGVWRWLNRLNLYTRDVVLVMFVFWTFWTIMAGIPTRPYIIFMVLMGSLAGGEGLVRLFAGGLFKPRPRTPMPLQ